VEPPSCMIDTICTNVISFERSCPIPYGNLLPIECLLVWNHLLANLNICYHHHEYHWLDTIEETFNSRYPLALLSLYSNHHELC